MRKQLKNSLLPLLLLLILQKGNAQRIDTIINKPAYQSYFSFAVKSPLYVVYYLYKCGGDCSRERFLFTKEYRSANNKDYLKSGFDRGHLANAEDFAFDCEMERCTFSYYNCLPQHQKLNRNQAHHACLVVQKRCLTGRATHHPFSTETNAGLSRRIQCQLIIFS